MQHHIKSIRPFIGAKDYALCRSFYRDLGFQESVITPKMSYFYSADFGFYLQDAYIQDWIDNTMVFVEVKDVESHWQSLVALNLPNKYPSVRLVPIRHEDWGSECFLHDPSGVLWHFGTFV